MVWRRSVRRRESCGQGLIIGSGSESSEWVNHTRNVAAWRDSDISRSGGEGGIAVGVSGGLKGSWWHWLSVEGRGERLGEDPLIGATTSRRRTVGSLLGWRASFTLRGSADSHCTRANTAGCLKSERGTGERSRVDSGHPDAGLIDFEEICDKRVEVDVGVSEVVESKFLPVPAHLLGQILRSAKQSNSHLELCIENLHVQTVFLDFLHADPLCLCFISFFIA